MSCTVGSSRSAVELTIGAMETQAPDIVGIVGMCPQLLDDNTFVTRARNGIILPLTEDGNTDSSKLLHIVHLYPEHSDGVSLIEVVGIEGGSCLCSLIVGY